MDSVEQILDKKSVELEFNDGTAQIVDVKRVPMRLSKEYALTLGDSEADEVKYYIDRNEEWLDKLSASGWNDLIMAGREVNKDALGKFQGRLKSLAEMLTPSEESK